MKAQYYKCWIGLFGFKREDVITSLIRSMLPWYIKILFYQMDQWDAMAYEAEVNFRTEREKTEAARVSSRVPAGAVKFPEYNSKNELRRDANTGRINSNHIHVSNIPKSIEEFSIPDTRHTVFQNDIVPLIVAEDLMIMDDFNSGDQTPMITDPSFEVPVDNSQPIFQGFNGGDGGGAGAQGSWVPPNDTPSIPNYEPTPDVSTPDPVEYEQPTDNTDNNYSFDSN